MELYLIKINTLFSFQSCSSKIKHLQGLLQEMDPVWTTTVLLVPCVVVLTAGLFYLYGAVIGLLTKTSVRNKVVVITDALSGLGKGKHWLTGKRALCKVFLCADHVFFLFMDGWRMLRCVSQRRSEADPLWEKLGETGRACWWFGQNLRPHRGENVTDGLPQPDVILWHHSGSVLLLDRLHVELV